jgi:hypothetical protein
MRDLWSAQRLDSPKRTMPRGYTVDRSHRSAACSATCRARDVDPVAADTSLTVFAQKG